MSYVRVIDAAIAPDTETSQPRDLRRLDDGGVVLWSIYITAEQLAACGWFEVVAVARPADTATHTFDRTLTLVAGVPTETWVQRPKTAPEVAAATATANDATLRSNPQTHIDVLVASLATLQTLVNRTNADINANPAAAIKDVARELMAAERRLVRLFRLTLGVLDSTDGAT